MSPAVVVVGDVDTAWSLIVITIGAVDFDAVDFDVADAKGDASAGNACAADAMSTLDHTATIERSRCLRQGIRECSGILCFLHFLVARSEQGDVDRGRR